VPSFNHGSVIIGFGPHITDLGFNSGNMFKNSFSLFDQIEREFDKQLHHEGHEGFKQKEAPDELLRLKHENEMDRFRLVQEERKLHVEQKHLDGLARVEMGLIVLIVMLVFAII